jgi:hypothetical protein
LSYTANMFIPMILYDFRLYCLVVPVAFHKPLCTDRVENTVSNSNSVFVGVFLTAGTCLPISCLESGCITPLFIRLFHSNGCKCTIFFRSRFCY